MEKKKTASSSSSCKSGQCTSGKCSSGSAKSGKAEVQQNLDDIRQALEKILAATSYEQIARLPAKEKADKDKLSSVAKLHSHAAEAYAQLLEMLARR